MCKRLLDIMSEKIRLKLKRLIYIGLSNIKKDISSFFINFLKLETKENFKKGANSLFLHL